MPFHDFLCQAPTLETPRLRLRPFTYADLPSYMAFLTDPDVQRWLGGIMIPKDEKRQRQWVDNINGRCLKAKLVLTWCVEEKETGNVIGRVDLGGFVRKSMADLSYYFNKEHWGRGYATEAVHAVVAFGFEQLQLHRIQATVMPENVASLRVLEKAGFSREGLLRQTDFGAEFHDAWMLSILKDEYLTR